MMPPGILRLWTVGGFAADTRKATQELLALSVGTTEPASSGCSGGRPVVALGIGTATLATPSGGQLTFTKRQRDHC